MLKGNLKMNIQKPDQVYFPNLNGIRFIAAFLVIIHHIEQIKSVNRIDNVWHTSSFIKIIGHLGVVLFFVLSGFLITYLLLHEEQKTTTIKIKKFYMRRVLRIWPLYFLIIFLALFILPNIHFFQWPGFSRDVVWENLGLKVILFFTFFSNLVLALLGMVPYAGQTWSIGTEEQFYLVWPWVIKYVKKNRIYLMIIVFVGYIIIRKTLNKYFGGSSGFENVLVQFWNGFSIQSMAVGGFFAVIAFQKHKLFKWFVNNYVFFGILTITILLIASGYRFEKYHDELFALLFGIIIINFALNPAIGFSLENGFFNYTGKISYGLYMYHNITIYLVLKICFAYSITSNLVIYPIVVAFTILIASLSYTYFEKYFLGLKNRFNYIKEKDKATPGRIINLNPYWQLIGWSKLNIVKTRLVINNKK